MPGFEDSLREALSLDVPYSQRPNAAKALDHVRSLLIIDINNDRQWQLWLKSVLGDQTDLAEARIQLMHARVRRDPTTQRAHRGGRFARAPRARARR